MLTDSKMLLKPSVIISMLGCHTDDFPAAFMLECIVLLKQKHPALPISLCYEADPECTLKALKDECENAVKSRISRFPGEKYSIDEENNDKSLYWLLKAVEFQKITFVQSDLKNIRKIPLGKGEPFRAHREKCMSDSLLKVARERGGIILDFGGLSHIAGIQCNLMQDNAFKTARDANDLKTHFYCVYADAAQKYISLQFRSMQFLGIPKEQYPLGLEFKTTVCDGQANLDLDSYASLELEDKTRKALYAEFYKTVLAPAALHLSKVLAGKIEAAPVVANAPILPQANAAMKKKEPEVKKEVEPTIETDSVAVKPFTYQIMW